MSTPINQVQTSNDNSGDDDIVQDILNQMDKEAQEVEQDYNQQQDNYNDQQFGMDPQNDMPQNVAYQASQQYQPPPQQMQPEMNYQPQQQHQYYQEPTQIMNSEMTWVQKVTHFVMRYGKTTILASAIIFMMCLPVVGKTIVRYIPKFSNQYGGLNIWGLLLRALMSGILISSVNCLV